MCAVPVVAYAATGTVDAVADAIGGRLVPVGDVRALGVALADVLQDTTRSTFDGRSWVAERFDRRVLWAELCARYLAWNDG